MICRVCLLDVKKSAVICSQCSLISHSKCAPNAPPTCDLRAQLLLYAQYAEKGNPASLYQNPADALGSNRPSGALSDVPYVTHSEPSPPNDSVQPSSVQLSTGFKFISAFRRSSRSNLAEQAAPGTVSQPPVAPGEGKVVRRKTAFLTRRRDRPLSLTSNSTGVSSLRSAAESLSSGPDARKSRKSVEGGRHSDPGGRSRMASVVDSIDGDGMPGSLPSEIHNRRDSKSNSGCIVQ